MSRHEAAPPSEVATERTSPAMLPFFVCVFLMDFGGGVGLLAVPLLATAMDASPALLGYIGTAGGLGYVSMAALAGRLSDRIGRTALPLIGAVCLSLLFFVYPWLPGPVYMIPLALVIGVAWGFFWPPMESWIADVFEGPHLTRALSGFNVSWSTGSTIGMFLAGYLFAAARWLPFLVAVIVPLLVVAALTRLPRPRRESSEPLPADDRADPPQKTHVTALWFAWTLNFTIIFALGATRNLFPKLADDLAISSGQISLIMGAISLFRVLTFVLIRARASIPRGPALFVPPSLLLIVGMLGFVFSSSTFAFVVASVAVGVSSGIAYSGSLLMSLSVSEARGARSGAHEAILGSGILAGPFICGLAASRFDLRAPYIVSGALALVVLAVHTTIWWWQQRREAAADRPA